MSDELHFVILKKEYIGNRIFNENYAWMLLPGELSIIGIVWLNALQFDNPSKKSFLVL